jgi:peptide/nickel transport system substrate-binding protein
MNLRQAISRTTAIVVAIIIIIAAVAIAYYASRPAPPATTTTTPTTTTSPTTTTPSPTTTTTTTTTVAPPQKTLHKTVLYIISNDDTTRIQLYKSGVVDIAAVPPERWADVNGTAIDGYKLELYIRKDKPRLTIQHIIINTENEPLNNPDVRRALAYAVPYDYIIEKLLAGLYVRLYTIVPKGMFGWTDYNIEHYEFNLTKAREILDATGIDPSQYTIRVSYNTGNTVRAQIAALLQNWWSRLGFRVVVETYTWPVYLDHVDNFDFDVALLGWIPDYLDADNYLSPFVWGGAEFTDIVYYKDASTNDISTYLADVERVVDTEDYVVIIGPKGSGAQVPANLPSKPLLIVAYELDVEATQSNWENPYSMVTVGAPNWRDVPVSALVKLAQRVIDPEVRKAVINAAVIVFNNEAPMIMIAQAVTGENHGSWVRDVYYPLTAFMRYDLVWEYSDAPVKETGVRDIVNDAETMVIATIGWPDTFDPAKSYESFGWEIFEQIYDTPITYYKEDIEPRPDIAVAWVFNEAGDELYLVIRGGVKAYDPWNDETYDIDAVDVLFSIWRAGRLQLDPSWMINSFIDLNASSVLTEDELNQLLQQGVYETVYLGEEAQVSSLQDLLDFFGYTGETAGVVKLKLYFPYSPILHVLATKIYSVLPMEYVLGDNYTDALQASNNGRNPAAWAEFIGVGEDDPTHILVGEHPVGTGPYYVEDYREDSYIILRLNPHYWNATWWEQLYGYTP